ncbi:MAG: hypothetical protein AAB817_00690, partial [Patescibacteria group bacterium]
VKLLPLLLALGVSRASRITSSLPSIFASMFLSLLSWISPGQPPDAFPCPLRKLRRQIPSRQFQFDAPGQQRLD